MKKIKNPLKTNHSDFGGNSVSNSNFNFVKLVIKFKFSNLSITLFQRKLRPNELLNSLHLPSSSSVLGVFLRSPIAVSLTVFILLSQSIERHGAHVAMSTSDRCWATDDDVIHHQSSESFFLYRASKGQTLSSSRLCTIVHKFLSITWPTF